MSIEEHFEIDIDDGAASAINNLREAAVIVEKELSKKTKSDAGFDLGDVLVRG
jgi:acyl carrier protein